MPLRLRVCRCLVVLVFWVYALHYTLRVPLKYLYSIWLLSCISVVVFNVMLLLLGLRFGIRCFILGLCKSLHNSSILCMFLTFSCSVHISVLVS